MPKRVSKKERKHKSRRVLIKESIYQATKANVGTRYIQPFAIAIEASDSLVALLASVHGLLDPLSQIVSARMMEKFSRKKIIRKVVFLESLIWILFAVIAFLFYKGIITDILPMIVLFTFGIFAILFGAGHPPWFSWLGELVDDKYRGRWFSKKNLISGFVGIIVAVVAAIFLDYANKKGWAMIGFIILFLIAAIARLECWRIFRKVYEPKFKPKKSRSSSFLGFVINTPKTNFGRFALYRAFISFSASVTAPLLAVYLLRNLGFSYFTYMAITLSIVAASLILIRLWGDFSDRYGNYIVLVITSILIPIIPILWILNTSPIYLALVPAVVTGIASSGFLLASGNFIYDSVPKGTRGELVSYFNMMRGIGIFLGAGLGAILIKYLSIQSIEPIIAIFIFGAILRMLVVFFGLNTIKEVRKTKKLKGIKGLRKALLKEITPTIEEEAHQISSIKTYLE